MFIKDSAFFKRNQLINISFKQISIQLPLPFPLHMPYSPLPVKQYQRETSAALTGDEQETRV